MICRGGFETRPYNRFLGGYAEGVTPVPIPNTEVKPLRADGTAWVAVWESRSPPGIERQRAPSLQSDGALCLSNTVNLGQRNHKRQNT